ncbi:MAG: MBL fold metallo-hydrolase [Myxococcota bacterium]
MKQLHRPDLFAWSVFDEDRDMDFHGFYWARPDEGGVAVDPVPASQHDLRHMEELGGVAWIVVTNSDHVRDAATLAAEFDAKVAGPRGEQDTLPLHVDRWLGEGDEVVPGLAVLEMEGSKTPGELALVLEGSTLVTGDLVRGPAGGSLAMLPPAKLRDLQAAYGSVRRLLDIQDLDAVLVGDGWPVFKGGRAAIAELIVSLTG